MANVMEKVSSNTKQVVNMKDIGTEILETEKDLKGILMEILILASLNTEKLMERESILGKMAKYTMVSGTKASNKDTVFGKGLEMIRISESGVLQKHMDTVYIIGPTEIAMKGSGICALNTVMEQIRL